MTTGFLIRLSLLNTFKKRLRAILAITGIALTSAAMVVLFGVETGLHNLIDTQVSSGGPIDVLTVNQRNVQQIKLDDERISKIQSLSGVSQVGRSVGLLGNAVYHGINLNLPLYAVTNDYFVMNPAPVFAGSTTSQPAADNIIVSAKVLEAYDIQSKTAIGTKIQLSATITNDYASKLSTATLTTTPKAYTIVGVVDRGALPVIYMPIEQLYTQGMDSVAQIKLQLTTPDKMPAVRSTIEQMGFQTTSIQDTIDQIDKLFDVIRGILMLFAVVVFVITVSGTFTIITLTLLEETKQIGFLRIAGLRQHDVKMLFIIQSIVLTFLGAITGIIVGSFLGFALNGLAGAVASSESFSGEITVFALPVQQIIMILMLAVVIGWLVGILPAKRAVMMSPLEELTS